MLQMRGIRRWCDLEIKSKDSRAEARGDWYLVRASARQGHRLTTDVPFCPLSLWASVPFGACVPLSSLGP